MSGDEFAFSFFFVMHLQRVMSTYWDFDCILFTALILIGDKEVYWFFANLFLWFVFGI